MADTEDFCDLCELPKSQCVHGRPRVIPEKPVTAAPKPRSRAKSKAAPASGPSTRVRTVAPARPVTLRRTPPEAFKPLILEVLEANGGELEIAEVFLELEARVGDRLLPGDTETTPEGELRWRYAARRARVALIDEGFMTKPRPGLWQLATPSAPSRR